MRNTKWFDRLYLLTVVVKGFDGLAEFLAGLALLIAPQWLHILLDYISGEAGESSHQFIRNLAEYIAHVDTDITKGGLTVVILFLLTHGIVKLALVYALLRKLLWAYPYALGVLVLFLIYQIYVGIVQPSLGMTVFILLDVIIVWVVWGEWRELRREAHEHLGTQTPESVHQ